MCVQKSAGIIITGTVYVNSRPRCFLVGGLYLFAIRDRGKLWSRRPPRPRSTTCLSLLNLRPHSSQFRAPSWTIGTSLAGPRVQPKTLRDPRPCPQATHSLTWPMSSPVGPLVCFNSAADPPSFHQHSHHHRCIHRRWLHAPSAHTTIALLLFLLSRCLLCQFTDRR